jgi:hypothetical protein
VLYQAEQVMTAQILVNFMKKWIHLEDKKPDDEETTVESAYGSNKDDQVDEVQVQSRAESVSGKKSEVDVGQNSNDYSMTTSDEVRS